jgi:hypothetical protein
MAAANNSAGAQQRKQQYKHCAALAYALPRLPYPLEGQNVRTTSYCHA